MVCWLWKGNDKMIKLEDVISKPQDEKAMLTRALDTLVKLYSEGTHFIFELIQNAEDAKATRVCFWQFSDRLEFIHDGKPFTESNFQSLRDVANSDKINSIDNIGKFGIGFLSVFSICNSVELYSEPLNYINKNEYNDILDSFSVEIKDFKNITEIKKNNKLYKPYTTKFVFPYYLRNDFYNSMDNLKSGIAKKLKNLNASVLLFLKNIKEIQFVINIDESLEGLFKLEKEQIYYNFYKASFFDKNNNEKETYYTFTKKIENSEQSVDIAFSVTREENTYKFIKTASPYISVYFPTEIYSMLNFIIQAPFDITPNRSSLVHNSEKNLKLILLLSELLKDAIRIFRDKNILSLELLKLLPYCYVDKNNELENENKIIRELSIANMLKTEKIIPTMDTNIFVTTKEAKIARGKELIDIFEGELLNKLLKQPEAKWLSKDFTEDNYGDFHKYLIEKLDAQQIRPINLIQLIKNNPNFMQEVDNNWLIKFYNYLSDDNESLLRKKEGFSLIPIIKTDDGNFNAPFKLIKTENNENLIPKIFIKPKSATNNVKGFLFIDYIFEKNCPEFINLLGFKEPNELEYFICELECGKNLKPNESENILQIKKAIKFLKYDYEKNRNIFKEYLWFRVRKTDDSINFCKLINSNVYQEFDLNNVSIKDYFLEIDCNVYILDENFYLHNGISNEEMKLLLKLGIKNSIYNDLSPSKWLIDRVDCYDINNFRKKLDFLYINEIIKFIKNNSNTLSAKNKSAIIINLLINIEKHLKGIWQHRSINPDYYEDVSEIVKYLRNNKWLFSKNKLVCSEEISRYDLDINIYGNVNENTKIYDILEFKKTEQDKKSELIQEILNNYTEEQLNIFIEKFIQKDEEEFDPTINNDDESFPIETIKNLINLKNIINNRYLSAQNVTYETVRRQIRTSRGRDKDHMRLRYHGFCQICQRKSPYWEVAEIFLEPKKELEQMNLSLCPNCASEYRILRNKNDLMDEFSKSILKSNPENESIVKLNDEKCIKFTNTHLAEIQEIIKIENGMKMVKIKLK